MASRSIQYSFSKMKFIISIIISTAAVILTAYLLPNDMVHVENLTTAILIAVVLAF